MFEDISKSVKASLFERTRSPLYGAFILYWCIFNWRALYLTVFVSSSEIGMTKLAFIENNLTDLWINLWWPLIFTGFSLLVFPFINVLAFWISEEFKSWKISIKADLFSTSYVSAQAVIDLKKEIEQERSELLSLQDSHRDVVKQLEVRNREIARINEAKSLNGFFTGRWWMEVSGAIPSFEEKIDFAYHENYFFFSRKKTDPFPDNRKLNLDMIEVSPSRNKIKFVLKENFIESAPAYFIELDVKTQDLYEGKLNGNIDVKFSRLSN